MNRAVVVACLCLILVVGVTAPAFAAKPAPDGSVVQVASPENNSTTQHERPSESQDEGDQADLRRWLQGRLSDALAESTVQLSQGQYEAADEILDEEYESYFEKYVNVTGETSEADSASEQALNETKSQQKEYISLVEQYQSTYEQYQTARENGNETRARQLARRLQRLNNSITQSSKAFVQSFEKVGNTTGTNVTNSTQRIRSLTTTISQRQRNVTEATFVKTSLDVELESSVGSFDQPFKIHGRLVPAGNASLPDRATIVVNGNRYTTPITAEGRFNVSYRPTTITTGKQQLDITYLPDPESIFLGANTSATATIQSSTPTVRLDSLVKTYQYADEVIISGSVAVNKTAVPGLPVTISIGNSTIGQATTSANGTFQLRTSLPADIAAESHQLTAAIAFENRAIAHASGRTQITVVDSETTISIAAERRTDSVVLSGKLTAETGTPARNQDVVILRNGTQIATATTNETGVYVLSVPLPSESTSFNVVYDDTDTNLGRSSASITVRGVSTSSTGLPILFVVTGGVLVGVAVLGGGYLYQRRRLRDQTGSSTNQEGESEESASKPAPESMFDPQAAVSQFAEMEPESDAVVGLYGVVRRAIGESRNEEVGGQTHWEFYQTVAPTLADDAELRTVTQTYERVVYADEEVEADTWTETVAAARKLVNRTAFAEEAGTGE